MPVPEPVAVGARAAVSSRGGRCTAGCQGEPASAPVRHRPSSLRPGHCGPRALLADGGPPRWPRRRRTLVWARRVAAGDDDVQAGLNPSARQTSGAAATPSTGGSASTATWIRAICSAGRRSDCGQSTSARAAWETRRATSSSPGPSSTPDTPGLRPRPRRRLEHLDARPRLSAQDGTADAAPARTRLHRPSLRVVVPRRRRHPQRHRRRLTSSTTAGQVSGLRLTVVSARS